MNRLLIFGGGGQLAVETTTRAAMFGIDVVAHSRSQTDIADADGVMTAIRDVNPHIVLNAAAYTKVDDAEINQDQAYRANAIGPGIIAHACAAREIPLIHISTDYVFDGSKDTAYNEEDPIAPIGCYGVSKAAGETAVRNSTAQHLILRTSWVYGRHGANFLKTMLRLAQERDEIRVVADQRGCPTSTADLAEAILRISASGFGHGGTYHYAGTGITTWYDFAAVIIEAQANFTQRKPRVLPITTADYPTRARRPQNSALDSDRFAETFGFRAQPWQNRTRETIASLYTS